MKEYDFVVANRYDGHLTQIGRVVRNACQDLGRNPTPLLEDHGPSIAYGWVQNLPPNGDDQIILRETEILKPHKAVTVPEQTRPISLAEVFQTQG